MGGLRWRVDLHQERRLAQVFLCEKSQARNQHKCAEREIYDVDRSNRGRKDATPARSACDRGFSPHHRMTAILYPARIRMQHRYPIG